MTQSLITSTVSESKIGHLKDLTTPVFRRLLKDDKQAQALIEAGGMLQDRFEAILKDLLGKLTNTFMVTVDYSRDLASMIKAGNYGYVNDDITAEHFAVKGEGKMDLEIVLVYFSRDISSEDALKKIDALGLRPAKIGELLAFGETHPEEQKKYPVICLGSVWRDRLGCRSVPCLGIWSGKRGLGLRWFLIGRGDNCRFAAVRKLT